MGRCAVSGGYVIVRRGRQYVALAGALGSGDAGATEMHEAADAIRTLEAPAANPGEGRTDALLPGWRDADGGG